MSIKSQRSHAQGKVLGQNQAKRTSRVGRMVLYGILGVFAVLVLAYIDAGEEPIHPIIDQIDVSGPAMEND